MEASILVSLIGVLIIIPRHSWKETLGVCFLKALCYYSPSPQCAMISKTRLFPSSPRKKSIAYCQLQRRNRPGKLEQFNQTWEKGARKYLSILSHLKLCLIFVLYILCSSPNSRKKKIESELAIEFTVQALDCVIYHIMPEIWHIYPTLPQVWWVLEATVDLTLGHGFVLNTYFCEMEINAKTSNC